MRHDDNPDESLDEEGLPGELFAPPPGIDIETESEGLVAPRDHSIAAGSDTAYPNTAEEYRHPESVADRAARELPDFGEEDEDDEDDEEDGDLLLGAHESELADDDEEVGDAPRLVDVDLLDGDDVEDEAIAERYEDEGEEESSGESPEESAMHLAGEDEADELDPRVERAQYLEGR